MWATDFREDRKGSGPCIHVKSSGDDDYGAHLPLGLEEQHLSMSSQLHTLHLLKEQLGFVFFSS